MAGPPTTHASLLARLSDAADADAWGRFVELYAPPVYAFARKSGLQDADAADLTQDVLRSVSGAFRRAGYDSAKGAFRGWLFAVVRNKLRDAFAKRRRVEAELVDVASPDGDPAAVWDRECERQLFAWAAERVRARVRPATWLAFWRTAVEGEPGQAVAAELGLTVAAVYLAKSRVMAALRDEVRAVEDEA
ncbi:MAG: sigma-70 family RNA polymerase sigma factor [Gemmataceae bacterium]